MTPTTLAEIVARIERHEQLPSASWLDLVPPPSPDRAAVVAFPGHVVVAAAIDRPWLETQTKDGEFGTPMSPNFLLALESRLRLSTGVLDAVLLAEPLPGLPPLELTPLTLPPPLVPPPLAPPPLAPPPLAAPPLVRPPLGGPGPDSSHRTPPLAPPPLAAPPLGMPGPDPSLHAQPPAALPQAVPPLGAPGPDSSRHTPPLAPLPQAPPPLGMPEPDPSLHTLPSDVRAHPRVARALLYRSDVRVWTSEHGVLILGRGLAGRWETAIEVNETARNQGHGRALAIAARHLVPDGRPVWGQVAPGNASSLRAFLAAGYLPVGSEVILTPFQPEAPIR